MASQQKVLLIAGYFDWFSGYQETSLAAALAKKCDLTILAGDRVSPIFSDAHLSNLGVSRIYSTGTTQERGATVVRVPVREQRSMVWSQAAVEYVKTHDFDRIVQVMPGQGLPLAAALTKAKKRIALYGDNSAMYAALPKPIAMAKYGAFALTKGVAYALNNAQATRVFGYTPNTLQRLRPFAKKAKFALLPLSVNAETFYFDPALRDTVRDELALTSDDRLIIAPGKPQPQKRVDTVVEALSKLPDSFRLVIAGSDDSETSRALRRQVADFGLERRVTFLPFIGAEELNRYYNAADFGVWPTMPAITIQQAMLTGLPVVIPKNSFTSHLFQERSNTVDIPAGTDIVASLVTAFGSTTKVCPRAEAAAENSWFSADSLAEKILAV